MVQVVVSGAAQVRLLWTTLNGQGTQINVLGAAKSGSVVVNQALANALGSAIKGALTSTGLVANLHSTVSLVNVGVRDISSGNNAEFLDTGAAVPGSGGASDPLPHGVALVVTLRTAKAGASYRGRVYLGGFTETENIGAATASAALSANGVAFIAAIQSAMSANGLTLAVVSRPAEATQTTEVILHADGTTTTVQRHTKARPGAVTNVTAIQLRNATWDSQRRRSAPGSVSTRFAPLIMHDVESGQTFNNFAAA